MSSNWLRESPLVCLKSLLPLKVRICLSYPNSESGFAVILWSLSCNTFGILVPEFLLIDLFILFELFTLFSKFLLYLMRDLFPKYLNMLIPLFIWLLITIWAPSNSSLTWHLAAHRVRYLSFNRILVSHSGDYEQYDLHGRTAHDIVLFKFK